MGSAGVKAAAASCSLSGTKTKRHVTAVCVRDMSRIASEASIIAELIRSYRRATIGRYERGLRYSTRIIIML